MTSSQQKLQQIWHTVSLIPYGKVATYGQIADLAGLPGCARLVGKALGLVPESKPVPWYRVINSAGKISFPAGGQYYLRQQALLQEEEVVVLNGRIRLKEFQWQPDLSEILNLLPY